MECGRVRCDIFFVEISSNRLEKYIYTEHMAAIYLGCYMKKIMFTTRYG